VSTTHDAQNRRSTKNATKNARMKLMTPEALKQVNTYSARVLFVGLAGFEPATS
jgi:hypothetical protein